MTDVANQPSFAAHDDPAAGFDAFYKEARDRLLLQTFALTGDLSASRSAVRDAFVVAWHHWPKLSRADVPEDLVRPRAWRNAQRRTSARPWGRSKNLDEANQRTLNALAGLTAPQRSALLLTQLAAVTMEEMGREIGLPLDAAERELQLGAAQFATERDIPTSAIPLALAELGAVTSGARWPRVTIVRRAGSARRRAHTVVGLTAAVLIVLGAGAFVGDPSGARPDLDRATLPGVGARPAPPAQVSLPDTALASLADVEETLGGRGWRERSTTDNSEGNGLAHPCQNERYADRQGVAAWERSFVRGSGAAAGKALQTAEASATTKAAQRAYRRALGWFTACEPPEGQTVTDWPRAHLISTELAPGLGDDAAVVVLKVGRTSRLHVVGVARTGQFVTATSLRTAVGTRQANQQRVADLLGRAVDRLCALPDGGGCASDPVRLERAPAFPVGRASAVLSQIDLPPVGIRWGGLYGTRLMRVTATTGSSRVVGCDAPRLLQTYADTKIRTNLYRTFVFLDGDLPETTGVTQVVGALPAPKATTFVRQMRDQIARCPDIDASAGTQVTRLAEQNSRTTALTAWRLETALPNDNSIDYNVAVIRNGTALSQIFYVSGPGAEMADRDFVALAERALERLAQLPAYKK